MSSALEWLLTAAVRAPSGDNTQPWRFVAEDGAGRITFLVDEGRDPSPMNAGQRMARIAVGAAVENVLRTAAHNGWPAALEPPTPPAVAVVRVSAAPHGSPRAEAAISGRVTNRRAYDGRPVPDETLARLRSRTPPLEGVTTHWVVDRPRLGRLAELIGRADATMFGGPSMRRAFLENVRFDAPPGAEVEEGLSLGSLELSRGDLMGLKAMRWMPQWLLRVGGGLRAFAKKARQAVLSASGLCLVAAPDRQPATDVAVGRAMQRAWLALTDEGLAAQPMMSLAILENVLDNGTADLVASLGREPMLALLAEFRRQAPEVGEGRLGYLMRFGHAPPPSGRTGRLPVSRSLQAAPGSGRRD
jgi:hypothetical protein